MADCYLFPVRDDIASIDLPLSVLEAMSCNLPFITTRFGGLDEVFEEGEGLFFLDNETSLEENLRIIRDGLVHIETRKKVVAKACSLLVFTDGASIYMENCDTGAMNEPLHAESFAPSPRRRN